MLEIIDEDEPDLRGSKFVPIIYTGSVFVTNVNTFLNRDVDVEKHIVTGIEVSSYNGSGFNKFPPTWVYQGQQVNTIRTIDVPKFILTYRGKKNQYLHYNCPLWHFMGQCIDGAFNPQPNLSATARKLSLDLAVSYFKIIQLPIVTSLPIIIPITYYFDRENVFR